MTLSELRRFVAATREREGVNWYLVDSTPLPVETDRLFTLLCYDDDGRLVRQVADIGEQAGAIPAGILLAIAEARATAGINSHFLRRASRKSASAGRDAFSEARRRWLEQGRQAFLDAHTPLPASLIVIS